MNSILEELAVVNELSDPRNGVQRSDFPSLLEAMNYFREAREATDARDSVYGLLGMVGEEGSYQIIPDYSKTVAEVYSEATFKMIMDRRDLLPLVYVGKSYPWAFAPPILGTALGSIKGEHLHTFRLVFVSGIRWQLCFREDEWPVHSSSERYRD